MDFVSLTGIVLPNVPRRAGVDGMHKQQEWAGSQHVKQLCQNGTPEHVITRPDAVGGEERRFSICICVCL